MNSPNNKITLKPIGASTTTASAATSTMNRHNIYSTSKQHFDKNNSKYEFINMEKIEKQSHMNNVNNKNNSIHGNAKQSFKSIKEEETGSIYKSSVDEDHFKIKSTSNKQLPKLSNFSVKSKAREVYFSNDIKNNRKATNNSNNKDNNNSNFSLYSKNTSKSNSKHHDYYKDKSEQSYVLTNSSLLEEYSNSKNNCNNNKNLMNNHIDNNDDIGIIAKSNSKLDIKYLTDAKDINEIDKLNRINKNRDRSFNKKISNNISENRQNSNMPKTNSTKLLTNVKYISTHYNSSNINSSIKNKINNLTNLNSNQIDSIIKQRKEKQEKKQQLNLSLEANKNISYINSNKNNNDKLPSTKHINYNNVKYNTLNSMNSHNNLNTINSYNSNNINNTSSKTRIGINPHNFKLKIPTSKINQLNSVSSVSKMNDAYDSVHRNYERYNKEAFSNNINFSSTINSIGEIHNTNNNNNLLSISNEAYSNRTNNNSNLFNKTAREFLPNSINNSNRNNKNNDSNSIKRNFSSTHYQSFGYKTLNSSRLSKPIPLRHNLTSTHNNIDCINEVNDDSNKGNGNVNSSIINYIQASRNFNKERNNSISNNNTNNMSNSNLTNIKEGNNSKIKADDVYTYSNNPGSTFITTTMGSNMFNSSGKIKKINNNKTNNINTNNTNICSCCLKNMSNSLNVNNTNNIENNNSEKFNKNTALNDFIYSSLISSNNFSSQINNIANNKTINNVLSNRTNNSNTNTNINTETDTNSVSNYYNNIDNSQILKLLSNQTKFFNLINTLSFELEGKKANNEFFSHFTKTLKEENIDLYEQMSSLLTYDHYRMNNETKQIESFIQVLVQLIEYYETGGNANNDAIIDNITALLGKNKDTVTSDFNIPNNNTNTNNISNSSIKGSGKNITMTIKSNSVRGFNSKNKFGYSNSIINNTINNNASNSGNSGNTRSKFISCNKISDKKSTTKLNHININNNIDPNNINNMNDGLNTSNNNISKASTSNINIISAQDLEDLSSYNLNNNSLILDNLNKISNSHNDTISTNSIIRNNQNSSNTINLINNYNINITNTSQSIKKPRLSKKQLNQNLIFNQKFPIINYSITNTEELNLIKKLTTTTQKQKLLESLFQDFISFTKINSHKKSEFLFLLFSNTTTSLKKIALNFNNLFENISLTKSILLDSFLKLKQEYLLTQESYEAKKVLLLRLEKTLLLKNNRINEITDELNTLREENNKIRKEKENMNIKFEETVKALSKRIGRNVSDSNDNLALVVRNNESSGKGLMRNESFKFNIEIDNLIKLHQQRYTLYDKNKNSENTKREVLMNFKYDDKEKSGVDSNHSNNSNVDTISNKSSKGSSVSSTFNKKNEYVNIKKKCFIDINEGIEEEVNSEKSSSSESSHKKRLRNKKKEFKEFCNSNSKDRDDDNNDNENNSSLSHDSKNSCHEDGFSSKTEERKLTDDDSSTREANLEIIKNQLSRNSFNKEKAEDGDANEDKENEYKFIVNNVIIENKPSMNSTHSSIKKASLRKNTDEDSLTKPKKSLVFNFGESSNTSNTLSPVKQGRSNKGTIETEDYYNESNSNSNSNNNVSVNRNNKVSFRKSNNKLDKLKLITPIREEEEESKLNLNLSNNNNNNSNGDSKKIITTGFKDSNGSLNKNKNNKDINIIPHSNNIKDHLQSFKFKHSVPSSQFPSSVTKFKDISKTVKHSIIITPTSLSNNKINTNNNCNTPPKTSKPSNFLTVNKNFLRQNSKSVVTSPIRETSQSINTNSNSNSKLRSDLRRGSKMLIPHSNLNLYANKGFDLNKKETKEQETQTDMNLITAVDNKISITVLGDIDNQSEDIQQKLKKVEDTLKDAIKTINNPMLVKALNITSTAAVNYKKITETLTKVLNECDMVYKENDKLRESLENSEEKLENTIETYNELFLLINTALDNNSNKSNLNKESNDKHVENHPKNNLIYNFNRNDSQIELNNIGGISDMIIIQNDALKFDFSLIANKITHQNKYIIELENKLSQLKKLIEGKSGEVNSLNLVINNNTTNLNSNATTNLNNNMNSINNTNNINNINNTNTTVNPVTLYTTLLKEIEKILNINTLINNKKKLLLRNTHGVKIENKKNIDIDKLKKSFKDICTDYLNNNSKIKNSLSLKKTLKMINTILFETTEQVFFKKDKVSVDEIEQNIYFEEVLRVYFINNFGIESLAKKKYLEFMKALELYKTEHKRIELFIKMVNFNVDKEKENELLKKINSSAYKEQESINTNTNSDLNYSNKKRSTYTSDKDYKEGKDNKDKLPEKFQRERSKRFSTKNKLNNNINFNVLHSQFNLLNNHEKYDNFVIRQICVLLQMLKSSHCIVKTTLSSDENNNSILLSLNRLIEIVGKLEVKFNLNMIMKTNISNFFENKKQYYNKEMKNFYVIDLDDFIEFFAEIYKEIIKIFNVNFISVFKAIDIEQKGYFNYFDFLLCFQYLLKPGYGEDKIKKLWDYFCDKNNESESEINNSNIENNYNEDEVNKDNYGTNGNKIINRMNSSATSLANHSNTRNSNLYLNNISSNNNIHNSNNNNITKNNLSQATSNLNSTKNIPILPSSKKSINLKRHNTNYLKHQSINAAISNNRIRNNINNNINNTNNSKKIEKKDTIYDIMDKYSNEFRLYNKTSMKSEAEEKNFLDIINNMGVISFENMEIIIIEKDLFDRMHFFEFLKIDEEQIYSTLQTFHMHIQSGGFLVFDNLKKRLNLGYSSTNLINKTGKDFGANCILPFISEKLDKLKAQLFKDTFISKEGKLFIINTIEIFEFINIYINYMFYFYYNL